MSLLRKISTIEQIPRLVRGKVNYESIKEKSTFSFVQRAVSHQTNNRNHYLKAFFVIGSSYLTYKIAKGKLAIIPQVNAAILYHKDAPDSLEGRKAKFNFIADVVETSASSVVYIEIKDSRRVDFFSGRPLTLSNGSGFIVESNGLIITNAHVVTNKLTAKVEVKLMDGRTFQGVVEDIDFKSDLATVRINATNLPVMKLGTSSDLRPGEFVVAIGSPLSLSNTVTSGVVSSAQRGSSELGLTGKDMVYIQTDAAITFGNSGGPLMNLDGEAIGVNSMKVTPGISFAIPIDYVKAFLKNARGPKKTSGPKKLYIGITMITLTPQLINELLQRGDTPLPNDLKGGVLVWKVILGSPAHNGGLQQGDIVTHIDGKAVKSGNDVYEVLSQVNKKELKVSVSRSGKSLNLIILPEDLN